ncbi:MAG: bifunctional orotidine-5'-phosphate decarboxylase/orotate phosphoribosyltransferase [Stenomitos rutilans HA7619-LM2]|jgi:uridine monophosphate synthetase|nr:bifunctional orotidine-5'-phosphate decarboxylase/orotate phosphoribosyltransferase [Stenomitos rutilans HA7619-LM2]
MHFSHKLEAAMTRNASLLVVGLDPNPELLPARFGDRGDNLIGGLRDWLQSVIAETADLVCAYKPTLSFYVALGAPGMILLQETIAAIPSHLPIILDAKHSDLNTSTCFAQTVFEQWQVDAITVNPYSGQDQVAPFLVHTGKAVFVLCSTANPTAATLQHYPSTQSPLSMHVVQVARTWGTTEQVGLEVGTTAPDVLQSIRAIAPERLILARSLWQEGADLTQLVTAGLNTDGAGLLIPIPPDWLSCEQPSEPIRSLRASVNQMRDQVVREGSTCGLWVSDICTLAPHPQLDLILQLFDVGCILFGEFVQASGAIFPYYIDLRKIISNPQLFHQVLNAYAERLKPLEFDRIAGIPYGSLPTATGLSLRLNRPMIFPRKEVKAHGTRRAIEGHFELGERVVVVDDILISGKSAMEGAGKLQAAGLQVHDIVVLLDHEQGVKDRLEGNGYRAHSVLALSELTETLYQAGRITEKQYNAFTETVGK